MQRTHVRDHRVLAGIVGTIALFLAWRSRFLQDDAFISFVYARNLVEGHGLTWFGERVEGYTNFLWVLWTAVGLRLGADLAVWSWVSGLCAFGATMYAVWQMGRYLFRDPVVAIAPVMFFAFNYSVLAFATGGLETMLQTALLSHAALLVIRIGSAVRAGGTAAAAGAVRLCVGVSMLLAAAILTRPDSLIPCGVFMIVALHQLRGHAWRRAVAALLIPGLILVGGWLVWKWMYYGSLLPNTYYAKVHWDPATAGAGAVYVGRFLAWYWIWPVAAVIALVWLGTWVRDRRGSRSDGAAEPALPDANRATWLIMLGLWLVLWLAYLIAVGGDFMEFRLLVPAMPALVLLLTAAMNAAFGDRARLAVVCAAVILGFASMHHARTFRDISADKRIDSVHALATFYDRYPDGDFGTIGRALDRQLRGTDALLALQAVGAIPYYSRLRTLDMYGLNDRRIARAGLPAPASYRRPGHRRQVSVAEMRARGVNLVLGHPTLIEPGVLNNPQAARYLSERIGAMIAFDPAPIGRADLVAIPIPGGGRLLAWYLTPSPAIDAAADAHGWERATLRMR